MAKVETNVLRSWTAFFEKVRSFNNPMITVEVNAGQSRGVIQINNDAKIEMSSNTGYKMRTSFNGSTLNETSYNYNFFHTLFCVSNNFFYGQWCDSNNLQMFIYEVIDGEHYCGSALSTPVSQVFFRTVEQITIKDASNNSYKHGNRLVYTLGGDKLEYYEKDCLFTSSDSIKVLDDPNFIACTYVPSNKVVTFENRQHYSLNNYVLVLKDGLL